MDIQNLKYNRELMKHRSRLQNELSMINDEITKAQNDCSHIRVYIGQEPTRAGHIYSECLFCGLKELPINLQVPTIVAHNFKSEIYGIGETEDLRKKRMEEIRNLYIEFFQERKDEEEIISSFTKHIERGLL